MASSANKTRMPDAENVSPTKTKMDRAPPTTGSGDRPVLRDMTNASKGKARALARGAMEELNSSKRSYRDVIGDDRGFTYLKRRRLSHNQALSDTMPSKASGARAIPISPPSSGRDATMQLKPPRELPDSQSEDSGHESQASDKTRGSFSSLINYDPSSQQAAGNSAAPPRSQPSQAAAVQSDLSDSVRSRAELLRMNLKVAIYKVRTNQVNVPFSRLRVPGQPEAASRIPSAPSPKPSPRPVRQRLQVAPQRQKSQRQQHEQQQQQQQQHPQQQREQREQRHQQHQPPPTPHSQAPQSTEAFPAAASTTSTLPYESPAWYSATMAGTPSIYQRNFMSMQPAPSSSPPFLHVSRSTNLDNEAPLPTHDHDSLDSEATELAEDHFATDDMVAESPSRRHRTAERGGRR